MRAVGCCFGAQHCLRRRLAECGRSSNMHFASSDCRREFAQTTGRLSRAAAQEDCHSFQFGGSSLALATNAFSPAIPNRMVDMNECTALSKRRLYARQLERFESSRRGSMTSGVSTTKSARTRLSAITHRRLCTSYHRASFLGALKHSITPRPFRNAWWRRADEFAGEAYTSPSITRSKVSG